MLQPSLVEIFQLLLVMKVFIMVFFPKNFIFLNWAFVCVNPTKLCTAELLIYDVDCSSIGVDVFIILFTWFCEAISMCLQHKWTCEFTKLLSIAAVVVAGQSIVNQGERSIWYFSLSQSWHLAYGYWVSGFLIMNAAGTLQSAISFLTSVVYKKASRRRSWSEIHVLYVCSKETREIYSSKISTRWFELDAKKIVPESVTLSTQTFCSVGTPLAQVVIFVYFYGQCKQSVCNWTYCVRDFLRKLVKSWSLVRSISSTSIWSRRFLPSLPLKSVLSTSTHAILFKSFPSFTEQVVFSSHFLIDRLISD